MTDGCPGRRTAGISRLSAWTCCAIPWPELSRPTPRMSAPLLQIRAPPDHHARSRPTRATQFAPMPLLPLVSRLELCIKAVRSASYGPTQPKRGVVGCRLKLPAPLRARGKAPSGQVSRSREVYGCPEHAAHDSRWLSAHAHIRTRTHTHAHTHTLTQTHMYRCAGGSYPSHPTCPVHLGIDLLCAPNGMAVSGKFRMAPRDACTGLSAQRGLCRPIRADW